MSDGLFDAAADHQRGDLFKEYLRAVYEFVVNPTNELLEEAVKVTKDLDSFKRRGYWSGSTDISAGIKEALIKLRDGDRRVWMRLLRQARGDHELFNKLKEKSPYKDKMILFV